MAASVVATFATSVAATATFLFASPAAATAGFFTATATNVCAAGRRLVVPHARATVGRCRGDSGGSRHQCADDQGKRSAENEKSFRHFRFLLGFTSVIDNRCR
jgi:hypothetical protein